MKTEAIFRRQKAGDKDRNAIQIVHILLFAFTASLSIPSLCNCQQLDFVRNSNLRFSAKHQGFIFMSASKILSIAGSGSSVLQSNAAQLAGLIASLGAASRGVAGTDLRTIDTRGGSIAGTDFRSMDTSSGSVSGTDLRTMKTSGGSIAGTDFRTIKTNGNAVAKIDLKPTPGPSRGPTVTDIRAVR